MNDQEALRLIRQYIESHRSEAGMTLEMLESSVRKEGEFWYVPVRPDHQVGKTYGYYEELTDIEDDLKEREHLDVLLVPA